ncbi:hypothetical protein [Blastococcus brunescens]|uniref:Nitroreductase domain-containing protein n=1 Tax=Blastococcus brunescens TaxID=1564165 RepID=A0ABZ1B9L8_9ACTN|nr:hypothetical protein [Blastococcus sp. BMG 8361]WRL66124.1 hypothetical protein U6N30_11760 [Blastococcus sp. BMG 8361]
MSARTAARLLIGWWHALGVEFAEVVRRRRMVRDYDPDRPVPAAVRDRLLEHAIRAPRPASARAGRSSCWSPRGSGPVLGRHHRRRPA